MCPRCTTAIRNSVDDLQQARQFRSIIPKSHVALFQHVIVIYLLPFRRKLLSYYYSTKIRSDPGSSKYDNADMSLFGEVSVEPGD